MGEQANRRREVWRLQREFEESIDAAGVAWCELEAALRRQVGDLRSRYERALRVCVEGAGDERG